MAATDNIFNGSDMGIYTSSTVGGTYTLIAYSQDASLSLSMETRDITNKSSSGWRELLESTRSGSISGNFFYAERDTASAAVNGYDDLFVYYNTRVPVFVKFSNGNTGDKYYKGSGYITSLEASAPTEDNMTCSVTIELTGAIEEDTN